MSKFSVLSLKFIRLKPCISRKAGSQYPVQANHVQLRHTAVDSTEAKNFVFVWWLFSCAVGFSVGKQGFYSASLLESSWVESEIVGNERLPPESEAW